MKKISGPVFWKVKYPESRGCLQSPINIVTNSSIVVPSECNNGLRFSNEYFSVPNCMSLTNDNHGIVLSAQWTQDLVATVSGAAICGCYQFVNARFRLGSDDYEGSAHTIDNNGYAMEIQALHIKPRYKSVNLATAIAAKAVVIISYLFRVCFHIFIKKFVLRIIQLFSILHFVMYKIIEGFIMAYSDHVHEKYF